MARRALRVSAGAWYRPVVQVVRGARVGARSTQFAQTRCVRQVYDVGSNPREEAVTALHYIHPSEMRARKGSMMATKLKLTRAQRWTLIQLLSAPYCLRSDLRRGLLARRLVRVHRHRCSEHGGQHFVEITERGRRALGTRTWGA